MDTNKQICRSLNINCDLGKKSSPKTTHALALEILGNMYTADYTSRLQNLAFHDLTNGKIMPKSTADLLGQGANFIPKPKKSTGYDDLYEGLQRLRRDMYLRAHFATGSIDDEKESEEEATNRSKMYIKSDWKPPSDPSNGQIDSRLCEFMDQLCKVFKSKNHLSNLRPHELEILSKLMADDLIVIALADKGLGPCAVTLRQ